MVRNARVACCLVGGVLLLTSCSGDGPVVEAATASTSSTVALADGGATSSTTSTTTPPSEVVTTTSSSTSSTSTTTTTISPFARPEWLGTRVLEERADGFGVVQPTPPELIDRTFATPPLLPPPLSGGWEAAILAVPDDVLARSSWHEGCPVSVADLAYVTMSHYGFDGDVHTGEMIVNARVAEDVVSVFEQLFIAQFPIEEMRVTRADEIDAPPTGDGNVTGSFACRDAVNTGRWSQHAFGLAVDINPFHNPYVKGDLVIPELASYYIDRDLDLPGMVDASVAVEAFAAIGWGWGGNWNSLKDWMHFSESGN